MKKLMIIISILVVLAIVASTCVFFITKDLKTKVIETFNIEIDEIEEEYKVPRKIKYEKEAENYLKAKYPGQEFKLDYATETIKSELESNEYQELFTFDTYDERVQVLVREINKDLIISDDYDGTFYEDEMEDYFKNKISNIKDIQINMSDAPEDIKNNFTAIYKEGILFTEFNDTNNYKNAYTMVVLDSTADLNTYSVELFPEYFPNEIMDNEKVFRKLIITKAQSRVPDISSLPIDSFLTYEDPLEWEIMLPSIAPYLQELKILTNHGTYDYKYDLKEKDGFLYYSDGEITIENDPNAKLENVQNYKDNFEFDNVKQFKEKLIINAPENTWLYIHKDYFGIKDIMDFYMIDTVLKEDSGDYNLSISLIVEDYIALQLEPINGVSELFFVKYK